MYKQSLPVLSECTCTCTCTCTCMCINNDIIITESLLCLYMQALLRRTEQELRQANREIALLLRSVVPTSCYCMYTNYLCRYLWGKFIFSVGCRMLFHLPRWWGQSQPMVHATHSSPAYFNHPLALHHPMVGRYTNLPSYLPEHHKHNLLFLACTCTLYMQYYIMCWTFALVKFNYFWVNI